MTHSHVELRAGAYADSVTLLQVSRTVQGLDGVLAAQVAMATALNVEVLTEMGFEVPAEATTNDMVVALRLDSADALTAALAGVDQALRDATRRVEGPTEVAPPRTTASALRRSSGTPGHDAVALVSVPGASALVEAMDAVDAGRDVMVFSDNVPVGQEVALKRAAAERGVLVMGPDCGTAVVGGLGLGFANVVAPGPVGIVAASGTGCQQLLALLDHAGVGVGSALGVGGRDLSSEVRGASTREALRRLDEDPSIELIVVISKPPAADVASDLEEYAASLSTPVELALLGEGRPDLTAAAESVLRRLGRDVPTWPIADPPETFGRVSGGVIRGLFVGGTLKSEAQLIAGTGGGHTFVDFGDDEYTSGRAHPMIDPSLRLEHLARAAADPETGVVLLDVVLGHGAEADPAALLAPAVAAVSQPVVVAVVGTDGDPQGRARQVRALVDAGAEVHLSNAGATRRALELIGANQ
ncbi:FdrA family protein [Nocardioides sp. YIM 152315]|uniref:FdrA family protein n=1 Tax=Nocardioides sp. YIM 152315 TaxID=3031760 RepID=UPI0023DA544E|nr:FdrA family protein [Nocardioides sp. YIM 152315]MDF1603006.1 FdrA family protein [Nocardioides sp. YIM 152315]